MLTMSEVVDQARNIAGAVSVPCLADAEADMVGPEICNAPSGSLSGPVWPGYSLKTRSTRCSADP